MGSGTRRVGMKIAGLVCHKVLHNYISFEDSLVWVRVYPLAVFTKHLKYTLQFPYWLWMDFSTWVLCALPPHISSLNLDHRRFSFEVTQKWTSWNPTNKSCSNEATSCMDIPQNEQALCYPEEAASVPLPTTSHPIMKWEAYDNLVHGSTEKLVQLFPKNHTF